MGMDLLRGACHRAALRADPLARNDVVKLEFEFQTARVRVPAADVARGLPVVFSLNEGAGNAGCALHPRSRVQMGRRIAHEHTGQRRTSDIPCAMALRLISRSPRSIGLFCLRRLRNLALRPGRAFAPPRDLTPTSEASGPHDFAVRFGIARPRAAVRSRIIRPANPLHAPTPPRPPHPIPTFGDDGQRPFLRGQDGVKS